MSSRIRLLLLCGCVLVAGLEAPLTGRALRSGLSGPYGHQALHTLAERAPGAGALDVAAVLAQDFARIGAPATIVPRRATPRSTP